MREIHTNAIADAIADLCVQANTRLPPDLRAALSGAREQEKGVLACSVLDTLMENADIAQHENVPICQDTGMAVVFVSLGQDVHIQGGFLEDAVQEGVRRGYRDGYLRKSVVRDPIDRVNTQDNTPAVIHFQIVPGERLELTIAPKGFGSENMSRLSMLKPSQGLAGVEEFVLETVRQAGANPCPPILAGVGVGGTMEKAALLSKQALLRETGSVHPDPQWAEAETRLLKKINALNIGPAGFGGTVTALGVHILTYPTHIAGLPVAVNIGCHVTRHKTAVL